MLGFDKKIYAKVKMGDELSDEELDIAIKHYERLEKLLHIHGEVYRLVWEDVYLKLKKLEYYKNSKQLQDYIANNL